MDLALGKYVELDNAEVGEIDPYIDNAFSFRAFGLPLSLQPRARFLGYALPNIVIPTGHIGLVCLRSTWARLGLMSPPTVADPGFEGFLTMEVFNANKNPIVIREGDLIWNITLLPAPFEPLYTGRYNNQLAEVTIPKKLTK